MEIFLQKGFVQHLIHGNTNRFLGYQFDNTTISAVNASNISLELDNSSLYIKNTLNFLLEENQKFVDIIRKSMINPNQIIEKTSDFIDFVKLYGFVFSLLNNAFFENLFDSASQKVVFIDLSNLNLTQEEISSNNIQNISEKMKYMLTVISKNHFSIQTLLNKI